MKDKLILPVSIIVAGLLIGGGLYLNGRNAKPTLSPQQQVKSNAVQKTEQKLTSENLADVLRPIDANDHVLGNPNARVLIVEYSDPECPFCKMFQSTLNSIMKDFGTSGDVAWVYRHYPIAELHSKAPKEAEALECAAELGGKSKFWQYVNKIYEVTPSNNGLDPKQLVKTATDLGMDAGKFQTCLDSGQYAARVNLDVQNAEELGAAGTPYTVIIDTKNHEYYPLQSAYTYPELKNGIDLILQS